MPFKVVKDSKKCSESKPYACINSATGDLKGCHASKADAVKQMRALYANVPEARRMNEGLLEYLAPIQFTEARKPNWIDGNKLWVHILPYNTWKHPKFGEIVVDRNVATALKESFDLNVRGTEINTDYEHGMDPAKGKKASGWYRKIDVRDNGLHALIEFTETAKDEIEKGEWKYFSADWYDTWTNPDNNTTFSYVLNGGGLTNKPFTKMVLPINFSEVAVADPDTVAEHVYREHSEPGQGGEYDLDFPGPDDDSVGSRIDPPPAGEDGSVPDRSDTVTRNEGGEQVNEQELREALGIGPDVDIVATVKDLKTKAETLDGLQNDVTAQRQFAEMFPEQHGLLTRLLKKDHEFTAKQFSEEIAGRRFQEPDGDTKKDSDWGLSGLAISELEKAAIQFSEGTGGLAEFRTAIDSIFENGLVDYGERGSSRETRDDKNKSEDTVPTGGIQEVRIAFSEKVMEVMEQDGIEDYKSALRVAAQKFPNLAKAYGENNPTVVNA